MHKYFGFCPFIVRKPFTLWKNLYGKFFNLFSPVPLLLYLFQPTSGLAIEWHSFDRLLESCIQTSSVKANFGVGVTRTKILLYWLKDFHFQPWNYRKLRKWIFSTWEEKWQLNGELSMLSCMASLSDMHDLGSHRLHIYIYWAYIVYAFILCVEIVLYMSWCGD